MAGKWTNAIAAGIGVLFVGALWLSDALTGTTSDSMGTPIVLTIVLIAVLASGAIQVWLKKADLQRLGDLIAGFGRAIDVDSREHAHHLTQTAPPLLNPIVSATQKLKQHAQSAITRQRELELQLRLAQNKEHHAESVINAIKDAVLVTDLFNEVVLANEAAARTFAFDIDAVRHRQLDEVVSDPLLRKLVKDTRESGNPAMRRHVEHSMPVAGAMRSFDVSVSCVTHDQGGAVETVGVVTVLRDITREKEIADMKSDFVSNVSHELRTPLSSIKAYVEMLVDGEADDEQTRAEFYNIIQGETNRLSRLIDNILNISRIESGVVKVHREHLALPKIIHEVVEVMQPQARAKQIELQEQLTPVFFQVFADQDMIYQATLNLVSNAIKYTPEGGKVTLSVKVDEANRVVNVQVRDTGLGIPETDLPHLFDKFYRVANHRKFAKGTGLGLNLVKHIVETVHGGALEVTSQVNEGSAFTFSLPLAEKT